MELDSFNIQKSMTEILQFVFSSEVNELNMMQDSQLVVQGWLFRMRV